MGGGFFSSLFFMFVVHMTGCDTFVSAAYLLVLILDHEAAQLDRRVKNRQHGTCVVRCVEFDLLRPP